MDEGVGVDGRVGMDGNEHECMRMAGNGREFPISFVFLEFIACSGLFPMVSRLFLAVSLTFLSVFGEVPVPRFSGSVHCCHGFIFCWLVPTGICVHPAEKTPNRHRISWLPVRVGCRNHRPKMWMKWPAISRDRLPTTKVLRIIFLMNSQEQKTQGFRKSVSSAGLHRARCADHFGKNNFKCTETMTGEGGVGEGESEGGWVGKGEGG
jgi:hypothetical protein